MSNQTGQQIIESLFTAIGLMQHEACLELLSALEKQADLEPTYRHWHVYFSGIVANEFYRDWAEGERIFRSLLDRHLEPNLQGRVLIALGRTYDYQGRWREAIDVYERCLTVFPRPDQAIDRAIIWRNLAITIEKGFTQDEFDKEMLRQGVTYCQLGLATLEDLNISVQSEVPAEKITWNMATTWNTLGVIYRNLADWSQAIHCYEQFISLSRTLDDYHSVGMGNNNLGEILQRQSLETWPEALQAYLEALEIYREFDDQYEQIDVLTNLGSLYQHMDDLDVALNYYAGAMTLADSIRVRQTAPSTQADYRTTIEKLYTASLSLYLQQGDAASAFTAAERARSRVLADLLVGQTEQALPHSAVPAHLLEQRTTLRQLLDQAYAADEPPDNLPDLEASLANLDRQIELLDPTYASLESVAALTAEEIQDRLPKDAAMLAFAGDTDDRLWIMIVTAADIQAEPVNNVSVSWLRAYLADHIDGIHQGTLVLDPQTGYLSSPVLFPQLYQALLEPVWDTLRTVKTVYIIPFGPLYYVPLGAVGPDLTSAPPLLRDGRRVIYAPSATILFNYCQTRPPSAQQGLLAVAPEDTQLQFTLGGAETIVRLSSGKALLGQTATREAFLAESGRYRAVCFLGHGYFDPRYPMSSRLKLADGSLHASEMLRELRLRADLVILSACETGRSHILRGDEILGLSRAVLYAGTPSLLATLWPVHEIPTRFLIEKFISQLPFDETSAASFDPAAILATTQCWLQTLSYTEAETLMADWGDLAADKIETALTALWQMTQPNTMPRADSQLFNHPFFWAPFVLIGEGS